MALFLTIPSYYMKKYLNFKAYYSRGLVFAFLVNNFGAMPPVYAESAQKGFISVAQAQDFYLPAPGAMVRLSPSLEPLILKGIKVHTDNPFRFDFILDKGDFSPKQKEQLK